MESNTKLVPRPVKRRTAEEVNIVPRRSRTPIGPRTNVAKDILSPIKLVNTHNLLSDEGPLYDYGIDTRVDRDEDKASNARGIIEKRSKESPEIESLSLGDNLFKLVPRSSFIPFTVTEIDHLQSYTLGQFLDVCDYINTRTLEVTPSPYTKRLARVFRQVLPWNNSDRLPDRIFPNGAHWYEDTVINSLPYIVYDGIASIIDDLIEEPHVIYVLNGYVGSSIGSFIKMTKCSQVITYEEDSGKSKIMKLNMHTYSYDASRYVIINGKFDRNVSTFNKSILFIELDEPEDISWTINGNFQRVFIVSHLPLESLFPGGIDGTIEQFSLKINDPFGDNVKGSHKEVYLHGIHVNESLPNLHSLDLDYRTKLLSELFKSKIPTLTQDQVLNVSSNKVWDKVFTHISYDYSNNYEEDELLGDALSLTCFRDNLLQTSKLNVAMITRLSTYYLKTIKQAEKAMELNLDSLIRSKVPINNSILEDVFEAFVSGLKKALDSLQLDGYKLTKEFVYNIYVGTLECDKAMTDVITAVKQWFESANIVFHVSTEKIATSSKFIGTLDRQALDSLSLQIPPITFTSIDPSKKEAKRKFYDQVYSFLVQNGRGNEFFSELRRKKSKIERSSTKKKVEEILDELGYKAHVTKTVSRYDDHIYIGLYGDKYTGSQWDNKTYWGPLFKDIECIPEKKEELVLLSMGVGEDMNSALLSCYQRFIESQ